MEPPERPRLREDIVYREVEGEYVAYEPVTDRTVLLNASAAALLELCDGSRTREDIAREVGRAFSMSLEEARERVREGLGELVSVGLVQDRGG